MPPPDQVNVRYLYRNAPPPPVFKLNGQEVTGRTAAFNLAEELGWFYGWRRPAWLEHTVGGFEDGDYIAPFSGSSESREALLKSLRAAGKWSRSDNRHRLLVWNCSTLEDAQRFTRPRNNNRYKVAGTRVTFMLIEWRKLAKKRDKRRNEARAEKRRMNEGKYVHKSAYKYDYWGTMKFLYGPWGGGEEQTSQPEPGVFASMHAHNTKDGRCGFFVSAGYGIDLCDNCYMDLYKNE
jgi:hypothetical protein